MGSANLTTASTIQCPHGGQATLMTANVSAKAGMAMLLETDIHVVAGFAFCICPEPAPCRQHPSRARAPNEKGGGTPGPTTAPLGTGYRAGAPPHGGAPGV